MRGTIVQQIAQDQCHVRVNESIKAIDGSLEKHVSDLATASGHRRVSPVVRISNDRDGDRFH